jgi:hypothetical protein
MALDDAVTSRSNPILGEGSNWSKNEKRGTD